MDSYWRIFIATAPMIVTLNWAILFLLRTYNTDRPKFVLGIAMLVSLMFFYFGFADLMHNYEQYAKQMAAERFFLLLIHPCFYLYIITLTSDNRKIPLSFVIGILPAFFIGILLQVFMFSYSNSDQAFFAKFVNSTSFPISSKFYLAKIIYEFGDYLMISQCFIYLILNFLVLRSHTIKVRNNFSNIEDRQLIWVWWFFLFVTFIITGATGIIVLFNDELDLLGSSVFYPSYIVFTLYFMGLGIFGNMQKPIYSNELIKNLSETENELDDSSMNSSMELIKERFLKHVEGKKVYLQTDLKITDISLDLRCSRTYLSKMINTEFNMNFNTFINLYRVDLAKSLLKKYDDYSLDYIAKQSGFGSLSTFNRVFSQFEHTSPGSYRAKEKSFYSSFTEKIFTFQPE